MRTGFLKVVGVLYADHGTGCVIKTWIFLIQPSLKKSTIMQLYTPRIIDACAHSTIRFWHLLQSMVLLNLDFLRCYIAQGQATLWLEMSEQSLAFTSFGGLSGTSQSHVSACDWCNGRHGQTWTIWITAFPSKLRRYIVPINGQWQSHKRIWGEKRAYTDARVEQNIFLKCTAVEGYPCWDGDNFQASENKQGMNVMWRSIERVFRQLSTPLLVVVTGNEPEGKVVTNSGQKNRHHDSWTLFLNLQLLLVTQSSIR